MCSGNISELERIGNLTELVESCCEESDLINCVRLAKDLAKVIDELNFFKIDLSNLTEEFFNLFPKHWKQRTQFLLVVTKHWPEILRKIGKQDVCISMGARCGTIDKYTTPRPPLNLRESKNISIIEAINIYEEITSVIDIIQRYPKEKISIISPNPDFSKYLIAKLNFKKINYVSYVTNETIPEEFIEDIKINFKNISDQNLKKLTKELSEFADVERGHSNVSIWNIEDISKINSDLIIYSELNELYWKTQESGSFWLHNSLRKKLKLGRISNCVESLFYEGINKNTNIYLLRSQKSNGQNIKKSSILAKFEAITKKEKIKLKVIQNTKIRSILKSENPEVSIKSELFKFSPDINIRSIELLMKDPYAFYIKETLNLKGSEFNKEKRDLSIAFRNVIRCYFDDKSKIKSWLEVIKEIDFFGYQKSLNILNFLDKLDTKPNAKNNVFGKINIPQFGINLYGYCDRIEEGSNSSLLISYQTSSNQSTKEILYGNSTTLLSICLIAEKQGFSEIKKPIRRIQLWNIINPDDNQIVAKDIEISKELITDFENRLLSTLNSYFNPQNEKIDCNPLQKQIYNKYKHFKRV